jgi:hypothetical protein
MRLPTLGAVAGLLLGLAILGVLAGMALFKASPGGLEENQMWFGLFATIWAMPLSALTSVFLVGRTTSMLVVVVTLLLNWFLLGFLAGSMVEALRRRRARQTQVRESRRAQP